MIQEPPRGFNLFKVLGPGLVWSASAIGVSELVFATRAGALFCYTLLWVPVISLLMKFAVTELVGRYTIVTGENVLLAFAKVEINLGIVKLKTGWIIILYWIMFVTSVSGMAGIALAVGSTICGFYPSLPLGGASAFSLVIVGIILLLGSYNTLEKASRILIVILVFFLIYVIIKTSPDPNLMVTGLVPTAPLETLRELIPLLGWTGCGAIGMIWYSLWVEESKRGKGDNSIENQGDIKRIRGWIRINQIDLAFNTVLTALLTVLFLVAGAVMLYPRGIVPKGKDIGLAVAQIAGTLFGTKGEMIFLAGIFGTLFSTLLANIDGLCRLAANSVWFQSKIKRDKKIYYRWFVFIYIFSIAIFSIVFPAPVFFLQAAAVIDTVFLPLIIGLSLFICYKYLDAPYRPGKLLTAGGLISIVFFLFFIGLFVYAVIKKVDFSM